MAAARRAFRAAVLAALVALSAAQYACTIGGLAPNATRSLTVVAIGGAGAGRPSAAGSATTWGYPGKPLPPAAAVAASGTLRVSWAAPGSTGGIPILGYRLYRNESTRVMDANETRYDDAGLAGDTLCAYSVSAVNAAGEGPRSDPSAPVVAATVPDVPSTFGASGVCDNSVAPYGTKLRASFTYPSSSIGRPVADFVFYHRNETGPWVAAAVPYAQAGGGASPGARVTVAFASSLPCGVAYSTYMVARNALGSGEPTAAIALPAYYSAPLAPGSVRLDPGAGGTTCVCSWTAPAFAGGATDGLYSAMLRRWTNQMLMVYATRDVSSSLAVGASATFTVAAGSQYMCAVLINTAYGRSSSIETSLVLVA